MTLCSLDRSPGTGDPFRAFSKRAWVHGRATGHVDAGIDSRGPARPTRAVQLPDGGVRLQCRARCRRERRNPAPSVRCGAVVVGVEDGRPNRWNHQTPIIHVMSSSDVSFSLSAAGHSSARIDGPFMYQPRRGRLADIDATRGSPVPTVQKAWGAAGIPCRAGRLPASDHRSRLPSGQPFTPY